MKEKKIKKLCLSSIVSIVFLLLIFIIEKRYYIGVSIDRVLLYVLSYTFIICNIVFDYRKIWDFIFRKRYIIGVIMFATMVILGYNTTSIGQYDYIIQPNHTNYNNLPFWNAPKSIRSDEFLANTPALLSQEFVGEFSEVNSQIMGTKSSVLLFPKLTTLNISVLSSPQLIGFIFLDATKGLAFHSWFICFLSFFSVFELLLLITKGKRLLSLVGTMLLVFSPTVLWWNSQTYLGYGSICLLLFYKLLIEKKVGFKVLYSILLGWMGSCFVGLCYPAWQITYGYFYLVIFIWLIYYNRKKILKRNFLYFIISLSIVAIILIPAFVGSSETIAALSNTVYPGARNSVGGTGWELYFQYFSSYLFGYKQNVNSCELSQFISLYPIPIIMSTYYIIKNKKKEKDWFLILLTGLAILLGIWNYIPIGVFSKITLLYMSTPERAQVVVSAICVFLMIKLLSDYQTDKKISSRRTLLAIFISFATVLVCIYTNNLLMPEFLTPLKTGILTIVCFIMIVLFIINNKETNKYLYGIFIVISLFVFATVIPITKGIDVIDKKPISKEIHKIVKTDKDALWISADASLYEANYALANGARVINSVNFYPNLNLWYKIDPDYEYKNVYNRYAHIVINLTNDETSFDLIQGDYFTINLNVNDTCKLDAKYLISRKETLDSLSNAVTNIQMIDGEDGTYIYKIKCLGSE